MPIASSNGVELCYEEFGANDDPPVLMIMGLGAQMVVWPDQLCRDLAARGRRVIRFDNRDVGLSTKFDHALSDPGAAIANFFSAGAVEPAYTLADMATDALGLLDHLEIDRAHVVGASMGGMIAQQMVVDRPDRVASLTSIMSTTGDADVGDADPECVEALAQPSADSRDEVIEQNVRTAKLIASPAYWDEAEARQRQATQYDRCHHPDGMARQLLAVLVSPSRTEGLRSFDGPAMVVHGRIDPLVAFSGGVRTAEALGAPETLFLDDMAHDLPEVYWPRMVDGIVGLSEQGVW